MRRALSVAVALTLLCAPEFAFAASAGPKIMSVDAGAGWTNDGNMMAADGLFATYAIASSGGAPYIKAEGFGFSIPTGATINGVQVDVIGKASATGSISMSPAQSKLIKAGTATGTATSNATTWLTSAATYSMGGSSSLWGTTLAPSDVNASNFGVQVAVFNAGGSTVTASIDYIQMTVSYTAGGVNFAGATCTSIAGATVTHWSGTP
jgi:hypothetical protein